jgi:hypothetical protein
MAVALPMEQSYLHKAFLVVVAIVLVAIMSMALTLANVRSDVTTPRPPSRRPAVEGIADVGASGGRFAPITIDGKVCAQCR